MRFYVAALLGLTAAAVTVAPAILQAAFARRDMKGAQAILPMQPVVIHTRREAIRLKVEVARTPEQQQAGLMLRKSVPLRGGMIFPIRPAKDVSFWMKNTVIPLDILFIRADGSIARIISAAPLDETLDRAHEAVAAVLEMRSGQARALGIQEGDKVKW